MKNILSSVLFIGSSAIFLSSISAALVMDGEAKTVYSGRMQFAPTKICPNKDSERYKSGVFTPRFNVEFNISRDSNFWFNPRRRSPVPKRKRPGGSR